MAAIALDHSTIVIESQDALEAAMAAPRPGAILDLRIDTVDPRTQVTIPQPPVRSTVIVRVSGTTRALHTATKSGGDVILTVADDATLRVRGSGWVADAIGNGFLYAQGGGWASASENAHVVARGPQTSVFARDHAHVTVREAAGVSAHDHVTVHDQDGTCEVNAYTPRATIYARPGTTVVKHSLTRPRVVLL